MSKTNMCQDSEDETPKCGAHIVIVGAGFGGLACAHKLKRFRDARITIIDRRNHHLFQPLLYQVATSTLTAPDIARSVRSIFRKNTNVNVRYDHVSKVNLDAKRLTFSTGEAIDFDYLIMATGASTSYFGNDHWVEFTHELKSLSDAFEIRKNVLRNLELAERAQGDSWTGFHTVVIIGGGPTGVELAGAFSDLIRRTMKRSFRSLDTSKLRIILLEGQGRLLGSFHEEQGEYTREHLEKIGVEVHTDSMVEDIAETNVTLKSGEVIEAGTIIWAAGVQASAITRSLGAPTNRSGQVIVNPDLSIPGHDCAFVIGDAAAVELPDGSYVPGLAPAAVQEGEFVAKNIIHRLKGKAPVTAFKYRDKGKMAIVGKGAAVVDINGWRTCGWLGWLVWLFIHVLFLVDFRSKLAVLINWFWAYIHNAPGSRVFTSPSNVEDEDPAQ